VSDTINPTVSRLCSILNVCEFSLLDLLLLEWTLMILQTTYCTLKMEAIRSSETSVYTRSTRRHIPEDGILRRIVHIRKEKSTNTHNILAKKSPKMLLPEDIGTNGMALWNES
jgi:hypothetical protein